MKMTWMELFLLLQNMKETHHSAMTSTPAEKVLVWIDGAEYEVDIIESLTTGKIYLTTVYVENTDVD